MHLPAALSAVVGDGDGPLLRSPVLLAALIGLIGTILTTVLNNRAALKRERIAHTATRRVGFGWNAFAVLLLLLTGALFWRWWTTPDPQRVTATTEPSPTAPIAATCPSRAQFAAVPKAEFGYSDLPTDGARFVLQLILTNHTSGTEFVVSVCRDTSYWYFSRQLKKPEIGVVALASVTESGFQALYPNSTDVVFAITGSGGKVTTTAETLPFDLSTVVCIDSAELPPALANLHGAACTDATIVAWNPS